MFFASTFSVSPLFVFLGRLVASLKSYKTPSDILKCVKLDISHPPGHPDNLELELVPQFLNHWGHGVSCRTDCPKIPTEFNPTPLERPQHHKWQRKPSNRQHSTWITNLRVWGSFTNEIPSYLQPGMDR